MSDLGEAVRIHLHHVYPQQFFAEFKKLGIVVDDYVMQLTANEHIGKDGLHLKSDYNGRWQDFFDEAETSGRRLAKADAEAYLAEILNDVGLEDRLLRLAV